MLYHSIRSTSKNIHAPWLVFLAGYTGSIEAWAGLYPLILQHLDCSILLIDNLGSGKSPVPDEAYTTELMAHEVIQVLDSLDSHNIILIGHSLGGAIAQQITLMQPQLIQQLFLLSSFVKLDNVANQFLTSRYELMKNGVDKRMIAISSIPSLFGHEFLNDANNIEMAIQRVVSSPQTIPGTFGQLNACMTHDTKNKISKISCKTSIITGANDILVTPSNSLSLHAAIKHSSYTVIPNAAHMIQLEQPVELAKILINNINYI